MAYTIEQIEQIAAKLRDLPPIERKQRQVNKQEAVKLLAKEIQALRQRGYTLEQIADALRGHGLDLTTQVLKNALQRPKATRQAAGKASAAPAPAGPSALPVTPAPAVVERRDNGLTPRPDSDDL